jgi:GTP-binding protein
LFLLIDARHGLKKNDLEIMDFLNECGIIYQLVFTKADKVNKADQENLQTQIAEILKTHPAAIESAILTSASKQFGLHELRQIISGLLLLS